MRKILYICPSSGVGGAETFIKQTHLFSNPENFKNHYLLFTTGPLYDFLKQNKASVHLLDSPPRLSKPSDHKRVRAVIKRMVNEYNIDIIHSTMAYGAIFSASMAKKLKVKHVWFQHGPASGWMDRLAAILPHQGLIVNSHYTSQKQRDLENPIRHFIPRKIPIEKILLGTQVEPISPSERSVFRSQLIKQYGMDQDTFLIAMLCRIQAWKGIHILLEAIEEMRTKKLPPFKVIIWGEPFGGQDYTNSLNERIRRKSLPVIMAGHCEDVRSNLAGVDCLVNASIQPEPFGLSIIEAMMVGTLPVVPDEGGPIEIVSHGKNGLVFNAREASSLASGLSSIISDQTLKEKLQTQAQADAQAKFSAKRAIDHLEEFYEKVMQL
ncbi:MAG: glycosyltransferase family 4 protein [Bdellovibrionales bacterium]|nr:glycosyltransferase family 4 protein [Bdellovibrionales bacterium]